jgi:hypothetical protein
MELSVHTVLAPVTIRVNIVIQDQLGDRAIVDVGAASAVR